MGGSLIKQTTCRTQVGGIIKRELEKAEREDYRFVITGHSLGAGTASLIMIKCCSENLVKNHEVVCFTFASPPVYTPLENAKLAVERTINFIHADDFIPFVSGFNVSKLLNHLQAIEKVKIDMKIPSWKKPELVIQGSPFDFFASCNSALEGVSANQHEVELLIAAKYHMSFG